MKYTYICIFQT